MNKLIPEAPTKLIQCEHCETYNVPSASLLSFYYRSLDTQEEPKEEGWKGEQVVACNDEGSIDACGCCGEPIEFPRGRG